jgi:hypothetical protein
MHDHQLIHYSVCLEIDWLISDDLITCYCLVTNPLRYIRACLVIYHQTIHKRSICM